MYTHVCRWRQTRAAKADTRLHAHASRIPVILAQGTDADVVANRIEAANALTTGLDTTEEVNGFAGDAAAASARTWLATVGSDEASKDAASSGADRASRGRTPCRLSAAFTMPKSAGFGGGRSRPLSRPSSWAIPSACTRACLQRVCVG